MTWAADGGIENCGEWEEEEEKGQRQGRVRGTMASLPKSGRLLLATCRRVVSERARGERQERPNIWVTRFRKLFHRNGSNPVPAMEATGRCLSYLSLGFRM